MKKVLLTLTTALLLLPATAGARSRNNTAMTTAATTQTTNAATTPTTAPAAAPAGTAPAAMPTAAKVVRVNSASAADLMTIPGISAKIAADVIKNRPYKDVNELVKKVKGIGPKNVKKMIPYLNFQ